MGSMMTKGWVNGLGQILSTRLGQLRWDVVNSSWLLFLQWLRTAASISLRRMGWLSSVSVWGTVQYRWLSIGRVIVQIRAVFCPSVLYLSFFCEAYSWTTLDSGGFPVFNSGQIFRQLVFPLTVVLPEILFNLTILSPYPVFCCIFHAPLDDVVHFLVSIRSFRFKSVLSQFSHFVAQIKNFFSDSGFFLLTMFVKDLNGSFNHCCVEDGDHSVHVCIFIVRRT